MKEHLCSQCEKPFSTKPMLTIHLMEAHEFNPIESVSYKSELADALSNDTSAAQALSLKSMQVVEDTNLKGQNYFISRVVSYLESFIVPQRLPLVSNAKRKISKSNKSELWNRLSYRGLSALLVRGWQPNFQK